MGFMKEKLNKCHITELVLLFVISSCFWTRNLYIELLKIPNVYL